MSKEVKETKVEEYYETNFTSRHPRKKKHKTLEEAQKECDKQGGNNTPHTIIKHVITDLEYTNQVIEENNLRDIQIILDRILKEVLSAPIVEFIISETRYGYTSTTFNPNFRLYLNRDFEKDIVQKVTDDPKKDSIYNLSLGPEMTTFNNLLRDYFSKVVKEYPIENVQVFRVRSRNRDSRGIELYFSEVEKYLSELDPKCPQLRILLNEEDSRIAFETTSLASYRFWWDNRIFCDLKDINEQKYIDSVFNRITKILGGKTN